MLEGRRVLLVVSGGIAAYKSVTLVRRLREGGARVDVVLTASAEKMVGAATFHALSGRPVLTSLWTDPLAHVELGRDADLTIVAPATANVMARMALGLADDMATSTLLASSGPILVCPAMNVRMWENAATRENVETLRGRGVEVLGPATGELAEGEWGPGRMVEPDEIVATAARMLHRGTLLDGRKVVVTAGSTRAAIDPVRYVGNRSSGRMGFELAAAAWRRGADVVLIAGSTSVARPYGPRLIRVTTAAEMAAELEKELAGADVLVMAAAVSDFQLEEPATRKIKKGPGGTIELRLVSGPDLLADTRGVRRSNGVFTLGFALETEDGIANASRKLEAKGMDLVALNEIGPETGVEAETNRVTLIDPSGVVDELPLLPKSEVAERLLDHVQGRLG